MRKMVYFILSIAILGLMWSFFIEPHLIGVEEIELDMKDKNLKGLKIVHLSDFHSKRFGRNEHEVLEILNQLNFDFIFITGDFVDQRTKNLKSCQKFWKEISKRYPGKVFGVLGNHEYWHPQTERIVDLVDQTGIKILDNEFQKLKFNNTYFNLVGVSDPHTGHDAIAKAIPNNDNPNLLLAHSPEIFRKVKNKDIDLILSGHTHGGQIDIPILTNLILPLKYGKKYKEGLFKEQGIYLYVNRGIGTTILPIRFNSPPEVTVIKFRKH